jgi:CRP-like cAMP-binding protein
MFDGGACPANAQALTSVALLGLPGERLQQFVAQHLTQAEMAAPIGTVREMIGRALKTFEALGLVQLERGVITLLDGESLARQREE